MIFMEKDVTTNKIAYHEYFVLEKIEAGIVLDGGEVKSLRNGSCNLRDSFCLVVGGELLLKNMHITVYDKAGAFNQREAKRDRKLLLHKEEIIKLKSKVEQKGLTLVPLRVYFKDALVKVELGLCQGKHTYDKKRVKQEKDLDREKMREIKNFR